MDDSDDLARARHGLLVEAVEQKCERWGEAKVRHALASGHWQEPQLSIVRLWLARKEKARADQSSRELEAERDARAAKRAARSANRAAWIAAIAAMIAAIWPIAARMLE